MEGKSGPPNPVSAREAVFQPFPHSEQIQKHEESSDATTRRHYSLPVLSDPDELLRLTVSALMAEGDIDSATALLDVAKRRRATPPDNVSQLDARRRKS